MKSARNIFSIFTRQHFWRNFVLVTLVICFYCLQSISPHQSYPERIYSRPIVSTDYPQIDGPIEQVLECNRLLYVLCHHSSGIVQVYDLNGNYQNTLFFYCHIYGGSFSLAVREESLYVEDEGGNVYVFRNGIFDSFLDRSSAETELKHINFKPRASSEGYSIKGNSIWKASENGEICIIGEPPQKTISLNQLLVVFCPSLILIIWYIRRKQNNH